MTRSLTSARLPVLIIALFAVVVAGAAGAGILAQGPDTVPAGTRDGHVTFAMPEGWVADDCTMPQPDCVRVAPPDASPDTGVVVLVMTHDPNAPEGDPSLLVFTDLFGAEPPGVDKRTVDGRQAIRIERDELLATDMLMVLLDEQGSRVGVSCEGDRDLVGTGCEIVMDSLKITWP
ncbi:hypothetical protein [Catellatospora paridis]|uniref:hypothetical protein n=1 Tax=Catellatospora paridis TaxID=1617086 RepID=UPI0012D411D7|nr:hypothetical protein [Catellatospora paridis]